MAMRFIIGFFLLAVTGCATSEQCRTEADEPVSYCRAQLACRPSIMGRIGMVLGGAGAGLSGQRNLSAQAHQNCIDNNLEAQRSNAGVTQTTVHCTVERIDNQTLKETCR